MKLSDPSIRRFTGLTASIRKLCDRAHDSQHLNVRHSDMSKSAYVSDQEWFVTLIAAARENEQLGRQLLAILKLDPFNRHSFLASWIRDLSMKRGTRVLIEALQPLLAEDVADTTVELLCEQLSDACE